VTGSIPGMRVVHVLERPIAARGPPDTITVDGGPEFICRAMLQWAYAHGVHVDFIESGEPTQNGFVESFNGRLGDECLNEHWFFDLCDASTKVGAWRKESNEIRRPSSLGRLPLGEFARRSGGLRPSPGASDRLTRTPEPRLETLMIP